MSDSDFVRSVLLSGRTFGSPIFQKFEDPDYYHCDGSKVDMEHFIGSGVSSLVLRYGDIALKAPAICMSSEEYEGTSRLERDCRSSSNCEDLEDEKEVYVRLRHGSGIARCIDFIENGIVLEFYPEGSLQDSIRFESIQRKAEPARAIKARYIYGMITSVHTCHRRRVLVNDVALRNFLITSDQSIRMIDFGHSTLFPPGTKTSTADSYGRTIKSDIFTLGCAIYSVATWHEYSVNVKNEAQLALFNSMLPAEHVMYGKIIKRCWKGQYKSMNHLRFDMLWTQHLDWWKRGIRSPRRMNR